METPRCSKCQLELQKGLAGGYSAICEGCGTLNIEKVKEKSSGDYSVNRSVDMSKLSPHELEERVAAGDERSVKKAGFTKMMDEVKMFRDQAKTESEYKRYDTFLQGTAYKYYKKYN